MKKEKTLLEKVIGNIKLKIVRNIEYDEWIVKVYKDGIFYEEESYYTDDKEDAIITMNAMAKWYEKNGDKKKRNYDDSIIGGVI